MITCIFEDGGKASLRHATVNTILLKGDQVLLAQRSKKLSLEGGKWGLAGGFMGRGETLQEAAKREVLEETGYKVGNLTLLTINHSPDRPHEDRQNIDFVFFAEALEQTGKSDWEVTNIKWFDLDRLPKEEEVAFDHYQDLQLYVRHRKNNLSLPVFL